MYELFKRSIKELEDSLDYEGLDQEAIDITVEEIEKLKKSVKEIREKHVANLWKDFHDAVKLSEDGELSKDFLLDLVDDLENATNGIVRTVFEVKK